MQLRNDYKNFWCAEYSNGESLYIMESFGSFAVFLSPWREYKGKPSKLRAGKTVEIAGNVTIKGEYVEKCEFLSFEGQLGPWPILKKGLFVVQSSMGKKTAVFFIDPKNRIDYLEGEKVVRERLNFKDIVEWNEWK